MDRDLIESLVVYAREDSAKCADVLADFQEWRDRAYSEIRSGNGSSLFEITNTTQHGKSVSGAITITNLQIFQMLTFAIDRLLNFNMPSITFVNFNFATDR